MEPFQERQNLKVRKQEAIEQLLLFLFLLLGGWLGEISTVGILMLQLQVMVNFL